MPKQITFRLTHDSGVLRIKLDASLTLTEMKKSLIKSVKSKFPEEYEGIRIAISSSAKFTAKTIKKDFMYKRANAKKKISDLFKNGQKVFVVAEKKKKVEEDPFAQEDPYGDPTGDPYGDPDLDGFNRTNFTIRMMRMRMRKRKIL